MKIFTLNIIMFAIQCAYGSAKPPEVFEIVQESYVPDALLMDLMKSPNTMLRYLSRYRRQSPQASTMDTYIEAYKLTHENYQNQQESETKKVAEENDKVLKRSKRSADPPHEKDFIKFELTDAIMPDEDTLKHRVVNKGRNFRMPYEIADTLVVFGNKTDGVDISKPANETQSEQNDEQKSKRRRRRKNSKPKREIFDDDSSEVSEESLVDDDDDDMSIGESRKIRIIAPAGKTRNGEIPPGVQKIIEMVIQDRARAAKARSSKIQKAYGDKLNHGSSQGKANQEPRQKNVVRDTSSNKDEWTPVPQISLGRYPVVHGQMENAPDYLTFVPVKAYKTVAYGKPIAENVKPTLPPTKNFPQIQYIIKEVPVPVSSGHEAPKPSYKVTYDTLDLPTKAPSLDTSESYVKIITPTTATKTVIDHSKKPETYKSPTAIPSIKSLPLSSAVSSTSYEKFEPSFDTKPFKPSKQVYVAPTPIYENHFESQKSALTSLLNKDPSEQLKGFHELLQEEKKKQEDTAPILFHPNGIIPPKPLVKLNIKVLDDPVPKKQEPITIEEYNRLYGHESGPITLPGYSPPKAFTPITEPEPEGLKSYKTSFKSITETGKSPFKKVQFKATPAPIEIKAPVIHHDHSSHSSVELSKGYDDDESKEHGYAFGYRVRDFYTGNDFGHTQNKNTDGKITGEYHILLPDKRVQIVRYYANDDGFHADVSYETPQTH